MNKIFLSAKFDAYRLLCFLITNGFTGAKDFGVFEKRAPGHLQPEILSDTDPADISYTNKTIVNKKWAIILGFSRHKFTFWLSNQRNNKSLRQCSFFLLFLLFAKLRDRKISIIRSGLIFVQKALFFDRFIFGGAYFRRGLLLEGSLRFKIGWTSR